MNEESMWFKPKGFPDCIQQYRHALLRILPLKIGRNQRESYKSQVEVSKEQTVISKADFNACLIWKII